MEPDFFANAAAMLRAAAAGIPYDHIAAAHGVTKSTVSSNVRRLARALQRVVGVLDVDEEASPTASLLRRHQEAYLEALDHFQPGQASALLDPPQTLTVPQLALLEKKIDQHSHTPKRDKAMLRTLFSTGAKPLEIAQLAVHDYLDADGHVRRHSVLRAQIATNRTDRPLLFDCPETTAAIDAYLAERLANRFGTAPQATFRGLAPASKLFLTRDGMPMRIWQHACGSNCGACKEVHDIYRRIFKHGGFAGLSSTCARRMAAVRMRAQGASDQEIGHALGIKTAAVQRLLRAVTHVSRPDTRELEEGRAPGAIDYNIKPRGLIHEYHP